jgi:uncharacterized protein YndB with AHSA1/START domain
MTRGYESQVSITIGAPRAKVWQALIDPDQVKQYLHGATMRTDWAIGSPITWSGEWKGKPYVDKGVVLAFEPETMLRTTHWSPMGGRPDRPENYHTVTYELTGHGDSTTLTLRQDNNATQAEADKMAADNWMPVLEGLKKTVEG